MLARGGMLAPPPCVERALHLVKADRAVPCVVYRLKNRIDVFAHHVLLSEQPDHPVELAPVERAVAVLVPFVEHGHHLWAAQRATKRLSGPPTWP